jgi:hypothetical protein
LKPKFEVPSSRRGLPGADCEPEVTRLIHRSDFEVKHYLRGA